MEKNAINLDPFGRILVKFLFTNRSHVPKGIQYQPVGSIEERDHKHLIDAVMKGWVEKAEVGLHREGRVDTGTQFAKNLLSVNSGDGIAQLIAGGWNRIDNPHWYTQQPKSVPGQKPRMPKCVVCFNLSKAGDDAKRLSWDLPKEAISGLDYLMNRSNWTFHGWVNPGGLITLNHVQIQGGSGKNALYFDEDQNELGVLPIVFG